MKWPNLKPREFRLLVCLLVIAFMLLNYLAVLPWWKKTQEGFRALNKLQAEVAYRNEILERVEEWHHELSMLVQKKESLSPYIASQEMWMKHFESLADQSSVQLIQRRSVQSEEKNNPNQMRVDCSLEGNFESVVKFLHVVLADSSHPQIEACQLSPLKSGENKLRGQVTLVVLLKLSEKK